MVCGNSVKQSIVWPEKIGPDFIRGVINAFPFDIHSLYSLVGIFDVVYDNNVQTAAMTMVGAPIIKINKDWVQEWVLSWSDMATVIYHELSHRMLKHIKDMEFLGNMNLSRDQINFLLDVRVQGLSYQVMDNPVYQTFWYRYYKDAEYPVTLLSNRSVFDRYTVRKLHSAIYSPFGVSLEKVAAFVFGDDGERFRDMGGDDGDGKGEQEQGQGGDSSKKSGNESSGEKSEQEGSNKDDSNNNWEPFVGSHGVMDDDMVSMPSSKMLDHVEEVKNKIEKRVKKEIKADEKAQAIKTLMLNSDKTKATRDFGSGGSEFLLDLDMVKDMYQLDRDMESKMMRIAVETEEVKAKRAIKAMFPDSPDVGTVPNFRDKRALVLNMLGRWPVLFENMKEDPRGYCHVYIDNSGSQFHVIAFIVKLFAGLRDYLYPNVHFFSTKVWTVHKSKLKPGMKIKTTGGTDMNAVVGHALANGIKKAMVITDGYGPLSGLLAAKAKKAGQKYLIGFTSLDHGRGFDKVMWRQFDIPQTESEK